MLILFYITYLGTICNSTTQLLADATNVGFSCSGQDVLLAEIKRLQERLVYVESENTAMSLKLSQKHWEVESRLAEIEMQICGASSSSSFEEDHEHNCESII